MSLISALALLSGCANKPPDVAFYNAQGQLTHAVHCPIGGYEQCLRQMGELCHESGYTLQEKVHQTKLGVWVDDGPEILLVAQCKNSANKPSAK